MWIEWLICALLNIYSVFSQSSGVQKRSSEDLIPCERGWFYFRDKCYKVGGKKPTGRLHQDQAHQECKNEGGHLVTIQSKDVQEFLVAFLLLDLGANAWIGLHDRVNETEYVWEDGSIVNYTNWEPNEPASPFNEMEDCAEIVFKPVNSPEGIPGQWNDIACSNTYAYICENKTSKKSSPDPRFCSGHQGGWKYRNSCYHVVPEKKTWDDAEQHCQDVYNGHLVTILDFTVDIFLEHILSNFNREIWIGIKMQKKSLQQWTSGWYASYTEWDKDQSADIKLGTCAIRSKHKLWRKTPCSKKYSFICETSSDGPPILKQPPKGGTCPDLPENWWDLGGEYCYFIDIHNSFSAYRANLECIRRGGSLVSIHSEAETTLLHQFVKYRKNNINNVFIGLIRLKSDEDVFVWTDGSPMDYKNWNNNEPDRDNEKCGAVWTSNFKWYDVSCETEMGYICSMRKVLPSITEILEECDCLISSNVTKISKQSDCPSGVSLEILIGVSVSIFLVVILIGIAICCFRKGGEQQKQMSSDIQLQPAVPTSRRPVYKLADVIVKDADQYYENMS